MKSLIHIVKCTTLINERLCDALEIFIFLCSNVVPLQIYIICSFNLTLFVVISMNTRMEETRRVEEGMDKMGAHENQTPPQDNQVSPLEKISMGDEVLVIAPYVKD